MKAQKIIAMVPVFCVFALSISAMAAGDFAWMPDFNIRADADPSGFRAQLAGRFKIGETQINAVFTNAPRPADAYMICRLAEMSGKSTGYVTERYRSEKGKGWGVIAKSLGIKPGSKEFHALKRGDDLYDSHPSKGGHGKGKGKHKD